MLSSDQWGTYRAQCVDRTKYPAGIFGDFALCLNGGFDGSSYTNMWRVSTLLLYDRELDAPEIDAVESWIIQDNTLGACETFGVLTPGNSNQEPTPCGA